MAKISVLGAGSWGTALSVLLNNNGHEVRLWSRFQEEVDTLKQTRELTSKLPGVHIPENIDLTADVKNCVETAEVIVLAVPSPYVRGTAELMAPYVKDGQIIVNVAKGIEEKTGTDSALFEAKHEGRRIRSDSGGVGGMYPAPSEAEHRDKRGGSRPFNFAGCHAGEGFHGDEHPVWENAGFRIGGGVRRIAYRKWEAPSIRCWRVRWIVLLREA